MPTDPRQHRTRQRLVTKPPDADQLGMEPLWTPAPPGLPPIDQLFENFHAAHPEVYNKLVAMTRRAKAAGRDRIGMKMLFEVLRWEHTVGPRGDDEFKLNNVLTSRYARKIMDLEPDLEGMFETRALQPVKAA